MTKRESSHIKMSIHWAIFLNDDNNLFWKVLPEVIVQLKPILFFE